METYIEIAARNLKKAKTIIDDQRIQGVWEQYNCTANLVGSVQTGLLMLKRDIDFHVYSKGEFSIETSFAAIAQIAKNQRIKRLSYHNFTDGEDKSLDWHLHYFDEENEDWRIDIIHFMHDSPYVGKAEQVVEAINKMLTGETRKAILAIKNDAVMQHLQFSGIEVYKAVLEDRIRTIDEFIEWKEIKKGLTVNMWEIAAR